MKKLSIFNIGIVVVLSLILCSASFAGLQAPAGKLKGSIVYFNKTWVTTPNTTNEELISSVLLPANTIADNSILEFGFIFRGITNNANTKSIKTYLNGTQIGITTSGTVSIDNYLGRQQLFKSSGDNFYVSTIPTFIGSGAVQALMAANATVPMYWNLTMQKQNATDNATLVNVWVNKIQ